MYWAALLLIALAAHAENLALEIRAQTDFGRIELAVAPQLSDALACVQSEAALLPVTPPADLSLVHFRKGYCTLLQGILSHDTSADREAASEFELAIQAWPEKTKGPVSPALPVLAAIAKFEAGTPVSTFPPGDCSATLMPVSECAALLAIGHLWQGWLAARDNLLADAARIFQPFQDSGWPAWIAGRQALEARHYPEAVNSLGQAVRVWSIAAKPTSLLALLKPTPELTQAHVQLGEAQLLAAQYTAAIANFDAALESQPRDAGTIFLRGRARDAAGQLDAALADYELASRTAFADVDAPNSSGQAHFYRGVRFFRREDYARAEEEFASALNFSPGPSLRPDVMGWWRMAAVAGGACRPSTWFLDKSLSEVSDFFPKSEAQRLIQGCR